MRHILLFTLVCGCSTHPFIGPDDAGIGDAALVDGAVLVGDGSSPDGGNAGDQSFQSGSRIKVRYVVSSDGAQQAMGFYDSQRNENCNFTTASDGVQRCLPASTILSGYFTDSNCTQPLAATSKGCVPATEVSTATTPGSCGIGARYDVATVGASFAGSMIYYKAPTCTGIVSSTYSASFDLYSTTGIVAPTSFQDATEVTK